MTTFRGAIGVVILFLGALMMFAGLTNASVGTAVVGLLMFMASGPIGNLDKLLR